MKGQHSSTPPRYPCFFTPGDLAWRTVSVFPWMPQIKLDYELTEHLLSAPTKPKLMHPQFNFPLDAS